MTPPEVMNHPDDETLAAFIDGRLDAQTRSEVMAHVAECGDCRDLVVMAGELAPESGAELPGGASEGGHVLPWPQRAALAVALAAVIAAALFFLPSIRERFLGGGDPMNGLVAASTSLAARPTPARLSGDFPYRAYRRLRGDSPADGDPSSRVALMKAHLEIEESVRREPTVARLHALGVSFLLLRQPEDARRELEQAVTLDAGRPDVLGAIQHSSNAALLNDLAATYHALYERREATGMRALAVESARRAWSLERSPEIAFTRARVVETLSERTSARQAWLDFLALDSTSEWAGEARAQLENLDEVNSGGELGTTGQVRSR